MILVFHPSPALSPEKASTAFGFKNMRNVFILLLLFYFIVKLPPTAKILFKDFEKFSEVHCNFVLREYLVLFVQIFDPTHETCFLEIQGELEKSLHSKNF